MNVVFIVFDLIIVFIAKMSRKSDKNLIICLFQRFEGILKLMTAQGDYEALGILKPDGTLYNNFLN